MSIISGNDVIARVGVEGVSEANSQLASLSGGFGDVVKSIGLAASAMAVVGAAWVGLKASIATAGEFQNLQMRLENLYGSAAKGSEVFGKFKKLAVETPFELQDVVKAGSMLKAFGLDAENTLSSVADLAAYMELDLVDAAGAVGRAFAGGVGAADVLRERGVLNLIKSFKGIDDLSKLTLPEFREALISSMQDPAAGIAGAGEKMMGVYGGAMSNLGDSITGLKNKIGSQFLPSIMEATGELTKFINKLAGTGDMVKDASNEAAESRVKFDTLALTYEELHKKTNKTATETAIYKKTIQDLLEIYPNYFKNVDLEKGKWSDISAAIDAARSSLQQYLNTKIQESILMSGQKELIEVGQQITDATMKLNDLRARLKSDDPKVKAKAQREDLSAADVSGFMPGQELVRMTSIYAAQISTLTDKQKSLNLALAERVKISQSLYNVIPPKDESKSDPSSPPASKTGAKVNTELSSLLSEIKKYSEQKQALLLEGSDRELALLNIEYEQKRKIILNGLTDESKMTKSQKDNMTKLASMYGQKRTDIERAVNEKLAADRLAATAKEIADQKQKQDALIQTYNRFSSGMKTVDRDYYRSWRLSQIEAQKREFEDSNVEKLMIQKWYIDQLKQVDADYADTAITLSRKQADEWQRTHAIEMAAIQSFETSFANSFMRISVITTRSNGFLTNMFTDMANSFIQQVERMIAQWVVFMVVTKMFGLSGTGIINPFAILNGTKAISGGTGAISGGSSNIDALAIKIDRLASAIENNPPQIYTQEIKGVPFKNAIDRAYREVNAL